MNRLIASLTGGGLGSSRPSEILPLQPIVYGSDKFIKRKFLDARPYPNTSLEIRFPDGTIKKGITKLDLAGESGKDNMLVEYTWSSAKAACQHTHAMRARRLAIALGP